MSLEWEQTIVDARDPRALGLWWRNALGWVVVNDDPDEFEIRPTADRISANAVAVDRRGVAAWPS